MPFFITTCFSDWQADEFRRGPMLMRNGARTNTLIRGAIGGRVEGTDWYRKVDPDFDRLTYSRCHRGLRSALRLDDTLFFRTLWRGRPYIIGYFTVAGIVWPKDDPVILGGRECSPLIHYRLPVAAPLVRLLNPRARARRTCDFNHWVNARMGRNYLRLSNPSGAYLKAVIDDFAASP